jgi:hypothetical protein
MISSDAICTHHRSDRRSPMMFASSAHRARFTLMSRRARHVLCCAPKRASARVFTSAARVSSRDLVQIVVIFFIH